MKLDEETSVKIDKLIKELRQFNHTEAAIMLAKMHDAVIVLLRLGEPSKP